MKTFLSFVAGFIAAIVGIVATLIFGGHYVHKKGLKGNEDYKNARDKHMWDFAEAIRNLIRNSSQDFVKGLIDGKTYDIYSDKWCDRKPYESKYKTKKDYFYSPAFYSPTFATRYECEKAIKMLKGINDKCGIIKVSDVYTEAKEVTPYRYQGWGWRDISNDDIKCVITADAGIFHRRTS